MFIALHDKLLSEEKYGKSFQDVEQFLFDNIMELGRQMLQEHLEARGDGNVGDAIIRNDDTRLSHKRKGHFYQTTHFGKVSVKPLGYSIDINMLYVLPHSPTIFGDDNHYAPQNLF